MTPEAFTNWLADMKSAGLARSDAAAAELLGVSRNVIVKWKRYGISGHGGTATRTALACSALLHRMDPYGQ